MRPEKRQVVRPLLAVAAVTLVACGSTALPAGIQPDPEATRAPSPPPSALTVVSPPVATPGVTGQLPPAATPRVLPNGRPAPGNVMGRAVPDLAVR